ncbi:MAG: GNAT family N-acetyltransferase [Anaerolineaceae bacterium]|nr:GNAT family N-acetyltransferase [Anaerolineaceae bacterium]
MLKELHTIEFEKGSYTVSTDKSKLDARVIHDFLINSSYWGYGIPLTTVQRAIENSLCFGVYDEEKLVGFARVISDLATSANLQDVFILESHRGRGLAKWLLECIIKHPHLQGLRRWTLATRDAHGLYAQYGFRPLSKPDAFMEMYPSDMYTRKKEKTTSDA